MLEPGAEVVYAWPSFSIYPHLAAMTGARAIEVPLNDAQEHDLDAMASEVTAATRMVIVCNPNNPTATRCRPRAIDEFLGAVPRHVAVILDEAYIEFSTLQDPDESLDLLKRHPNLILLRTFSKVYGLCGLRVGYALGSEEFRLAVDRVRQPFSVNAARPGGRHRGAQPHGRGRAARGADRRSSASTWRPSSRSAASRRPTARRTSPGSSLGDRDEDEVVDGLAKRGVIVRAGRALGAGGLDARHLRHPQRERPLPRGAGPIGLSLLQNSQQ